MKNYNSAIRDILVWSSGILFLVSLFFLSIGSEVCYSISICYELSWIFKVYNYAFALTAISAAVCVTGIFSKYNPFNLSKWLLLSCIWVPITYVLAQIIGGGTNGWIPTSPSPDIVFLIFSIFYVLVSFLVLSLGRGKV